MWPQLLTRAPPLAPVQHGDGSSGGELALVVQQPVGAAPKVRRSCQCGTAAKVTRAVIAAITMHHFDMTAGQVLGEGGVIVDAREEEEDEEWVTDEGR